MTENNPSTNTQLVPWAGQTTAASSSAMSLATDDGSNSPKRKNAKVNNAKPKFVPYHAEMPPRVSYAGAASNAAPSKSPPAAPAASSLGLDQELQSICTKFLVAGETMLRPSRANAGPAVDPSKIPPPTWCTHQVCPHP